jgi:hypothetical protein
VQPKLKGHLTKIEVAPYPRYPQTPDFEWLFDGLAFAKYTVRPKEADLMLWRLGLPGLLRVAAIVAAGLSLVA